MNKRKSDYINRNKLFQKENKKSNKPGSNILLINNFSKNSLCSPKLTERAFDSSEKRIYSNKKLKSSHNMNVNDNLNMSINIKEYINTEFEDMVFEDVIKRDKRKFSDYFIYKIKSNLLAINTFFISEPFKPRPIKILLFILDIDLYFFINALFINEEFVSQIFHSNNKDNFFSFIPRCLDRCFYITLVGVIVNYLIEFFFIEEKKIKGIFKREKDSITILRYEISQVLKDMINRFKYFIIISFIIIVFTFYHISCFNNIYPHMVSEWIKSSLFIIIIMQILSISIIFFESIIRFISFKFKSEKIYKISLFLS